MKGEMGRGGWRGKYKVDVESDTFNGPLHNMACPHLIPIITCTRQTLKPTDKPQYCPPGCALSGCRQRRPQCSRYLRRWHRCLRERHVLLL
jgi:hypothetical protein